MSFLSCFGTSKYFVHSDMTGTSQSITDEAGNVIENSTTDPYGELQTGGEKVSRVYEGKEHDSVVSDENGGAINSVSLNFRVCYTYIKRNI